MNKPQKYIRKRQRIKATKKLVKIMLKLNEQQRVAALHDRHPAAGRMEEK